MDGLCLESQAAPSISHVPVGWGARFPSQNLLINIIPDELLHAFEVYF